MTNEHMAGNGYHATASVELQSRDAMLSTPMPRNQGNSSLVSRNVTVAGHRTSVRLEPDMWAALSDICKRERASIHEICTAVAECKGPGSSLTAAIRVFIMAYFRVAATDDGHVRAGHGAGMPFHIDPALLNGASKRAE